MRLINLQLFIKLIAESFLMAFHSVTVNKMRTLLTLLGITIGIFAIISVFTVLDAMETGVRESIAGLGDDVVYIQKWPWIFGDDYKWWEYIKRPVLKIADYEEIVRKAQTVDIAAFSISAVRQIKHDKISYDNSVIWANTHEFQEIRSFELEQGRYFTPFESKSGKSLAIIGNKLATELFPNESPIEKFIKINGRKLMVIGVIKKEGNSIIGGGSLDEIALIPINFARNIFDIRSDMVNPMIMARAKKGVPLEQMKDELRSILRRTRMLRPKQNDDFALNQASLIMNGINQIFAVINFAGWLIGGFSIIVGGFGIANIMFVTVRERTNQIGIQKALGAKKFFIMIEFLFEAVMLALAGGVIGLLFVLFGTVIVNHTSDFHISLTIGNITLGLFVSIIIGMVAGLVPAWSASRLNPVEAINTTF
jgi:putative ABC transport system permease protein